ncbi:AraC-like DNA-binding protein [Rhizobium sp. WW_1]|jgi:AraC-like DNA-binding protein|nr:AraC family transcriptional regulator [Rhizobium tropici]RKD67648.1 AraC-like DNA-binding protein [Rhizobium sp. WW_1]
MSRSKKSAAGKHALGAKTGSLIGSPPTYEHIITKADETFLWRLDDYPWERNVWNYHPEIEIHLLRKASGMAFVGDHIGEFHPGYLTIVGSNLPHDWVTPTEPGEIIRGRDVIIQFDPERVLSISAMLPEVAQLTSFFARSERGLVFHGKSKRMATEVIDAMETAKGFSRLSLFIQLLDILSSSQEFEILSSTEFSPKLDAETLDVLQRSLTYIFEQLATDIHLREVAELAGMSESAFSRFFKKNTGNSFTDHVNKLRVWQACKLLAETDMPITDICFEVGYLNISNFNRTFLRQHRMTPSAYRRLTGQRRPVRAVES